MALSKADFNNINVTPAASKKLKWNASANGFETGDVGGSMVLLSTLTASSSATLDFTSGIDSTYKEYVFKFIDIHPQTNFRHLGFQANVAGASGFNETITSTAFINQHDEGDSATILQLEGDGIQQQATGFQIVLYGMGNENDESGNGTLHLFDPSNTTFVKHFIADTNTHTDNDRSSRFFVGGYFNTTSAIDEIQFKMSSGNIDSGTIKMYGIV